MIEFDATRILISRMSAVGDTILTLPVACAIRRKYPQAYLGWVVEEKSSAVVRQHECLDTVIVLQRGWYTSPRGILAARRQLRSHRFNEAIDCQGVTKSSLACWLSGASRRIGYRGKYGCELSPFFNNLLIEPQSIHLTDRSRELLAPVGLAEGSVEWRYPIDDEAVIQAKAKMQGLGLSAQFAVLNPGASWDSKLWTMPNFGAVARRLGTEHGIQSLVVWGSQQEEKWAQEIVEASAGCGVLAPRTSLAELAAIIQRGRLFVGSDTGPLHMSVAVGTPTIGLHGVTRPQDSGPYGPPHVAIQVRHDAGTRRQRRGADNSAMRLITPEMVGQACDRLLSMSRDKRENAA